jgi:sugar/nucleoside kinase (ribokinase family)
MRVAIIGPLCKDVNTIRGEVTHQSGGVTYYTGSALHALGVNARIYGSFGPDFHPYLSCPLTRIPRNATVVYMNDYPTENPDDRIQKAEIFSQNIRTQDVLVLDADYVVLGPLFHGDFALEFVENLRKKSKIILAPQGLIRYLDKEKIVWRQPENVLSLLYYVDTLSLDHHELAFITGDDEEERSVCLLQGKGVNKVIVTRGSEGSCIYTSNGKQHIRAFPPRKLADPTGAGDSFLAGYIKSLELYSYEKERGEFAAMTATMAIEEKGPFNQSLDAVLRRLGEARP